MWRIRPKLHYFCHLLDRMSASSLNPRTVHTFMDETFVGIIARVAKHCSSQSTSLRALQRWTLLVSVRWHALAESC